MQVLPLLVYASWHLGVGVRDVGQFECSEMPMCLKVTHDADVYSLADSASISEMLKTLRGGSGAKGLAMCMAGEYEV